MAIKERKQITGTTAQIDAYAGHEGQIVWDKEKKTFVGMSGTAGTNYPLAPKEYVDNEVAKVKPTGDYATNAQLTEGLAGKEDKGVCLPKTGGLLSGHILLDPNFIDGNIDIGFDRNENTGSGLGFRSINHARDPGSFYMWAQDSTGLMAILGKPDGTLRWGDKELVRIGEPTPRQDFEIGSSGAKYTAPFTGKCCVGGPARSGGYGNVEIINESTRDQSSAGGFSDKVWARAQVYVRKGDTVAIYYYTWEARDVYWIGS